MTKKFLKIIFMISLITASTSAILFGLDDNSNYLTLYNFNNIEADTQFEWKDFTDQVMGGQSEGSSYLLQEDGELFLRLSGDVSLDNNGGFIQSRLKLASGLGTFNAAEYDGVRVLARGKGRGYYLFFRTSATVFPWLYYSGAIELDEEWQEIEIPWTAVKRGDFGRPAGFDPRKLKSVAIVAYGREFSAEVDLKSIGLYKD